MAKGIVPWKTIPTCSWLLSKLKDQYLNTMGLLTVSFCEAQPQISHTTPPLWCWKILFRALPLNGLHACKHPLSKKNAHLSQAAQVPLNTCNYSLFHWPRILSIPNTAASVLDTENSQTWFAPPEDSAQWRWQRNTVCMVRMVLCFNNSFFVLSWRFSYIVP